MKVDRFVLMAITTTINRKQVPWTGLNFVFLKEMKLLSGSCLKCVQRVHHH